MTGADQETIADQVHGEMALVARTDLMVQWVVRQFRPKKCSISSTRTRTIR
jgi:hypothetical protein